ncbi:Na+/H+ antiporter subunit G [Aquabacterium sp.]|uniref:Na+/H+ antiporter subunit G n=1 Tax=Aquabacterium sp. TaxID=1872578 RepID=UPI0024896D5E|nr:Na+/H+ antiporter subunit G [Aquabacterium sp.]MDI1260723.1 Na+/H+ antiporter subunit G [Aquabacterium sp.]
MNHLPMIAELAVALMLLVGAAFLLVGALGLVRFKDFFMRLHAPTKASTLGLGGVLVASLLDSLARGNGGMPEVLITFFVFVTAPVSANLLAKAALHLRVASQAGHDPVEAEKDAVPPVTPASPRPPEPN